MSRRSRKPGLIVAGVGAVAAIGVVKMLAPPGGVEISSNGAGISTVRLPRGVAWASLDFDGPAPLVHLTHGEPVIDGRDRATVASARRPNARVVWQIQEGPPFTVTWQDAAGQTHRFEGSR